MCRSKPDVNFILYSNSDIYFPSGPNVTFRKLPTSRRGALWHQTMLAPALRADQVDLFWGTNGYLPLFLPKKIRSVLTVHDLVWYYAGDTMPYLSYWSRRIFQPAALKAADAVVAVSNATSSEIRRRCGRVVEAVVSPVASDQYRVAAAAEQCRVAQKLGIEKPYLLAVGTLEPRKNFEVLIRAYLHVRTLGHALPSLLIAGRKGWLDRELTEVIAKGAATGDVRWLGFVPEEYMCGLCTGAVALIQPSIYEGFGLPVLEAQLCGTPAMIADIPSLNEAAGGIAVRFQPDFEGLSNILILLAKGELALVCRNISDIDSSAAKAGAGIWKVFEATMLGRVS